MYADHSVYSSASGTDGRGETHGRLLLDSFLREKPPRYYPSDEEVIETILKRLEGRTVEDMQNMDEPELERILRQLRYQDHISIAQLSRVTRLKKSVIQQIRPDPEE